MANDLACLSNVKHCSVPKKQPTGDDKKSEKRKFIQAFSLGQKRFCDDSETLKTCTMKELEKCNTETKRFTSNTLTEVSKACKELEKIKNAGTIAWLSSNVIIASILTVFVSKFFMNNN